MTYQKCLHKDSYTAQSMAQREHFSGHRVAKVVVVNADGNLYELVLPACKRVDLYRLQWLLGVDRVRLANEVEITRAFSDCEIGAIPPLKHWEGVEVIMDASMKVEGDILFQGGTHRDGIIMDFDDWFSLVKPRVENFTQWGAGYDPLYEGWDG
ncbi:MAG: YbaK/EbsC family protein [Gemmataceae bacterium]|nr:YbaK/EbsC family protein [Gemmataceae bacterium]